MLLICPVSVRFTLYVPSPQGYAVPKSSVSFHVNERVNRVSQKKSAYYAFFSSIVHVVCQFQSFQIVSDARARPSISTSGYTDLGANQICVLSINHGKFLLNKFGGKCQEY